MALSSSMMSYSFSWLWMGDSLHSVRCRLPAGASTTRLVLARQQPADDCAPDQDADTPVDRYRHDLVLDFARVRRIVDLVADAWRQVIAVGDPQRLHELPGGVRLSRAAGAGPPPRLGARRQGLRGAAPFRGRPHPARPRAF